MAVAGTESLTYIPFDRMVIAEHGAPHALKRNVTTLGTAHGADIGRPRSPQKERLL
jgi:hypothetical protein